jgi:hypothetical protein
MGMPLQLVLLLESGRYVPPNPARCLDKQCYCKSAANSEKAGNPQISCLWRLWEVQMCRKPVGGGKKIAHRSNAFPLSCAISNAKRTPPTQGQLLLIIQSLTTFSSTHRNSQAREQGKERQIQKRSAQTATVKLSSLRVTARYIVSRSNGSRPASVISRTRSARRIPCGVVAPASW